MQKREATHRVVILGLFATLWAVAEIELGFIFRAIQLPFFGVILTLCGFIILVISKKFVPQPGTIILVACTTAFLKLIYLGALSLLPALAIFSEGILLELILWRTENPGQIRLIFAGILIFGWTFFYPFFALGILSGWKFSKIIQLIIGWGALLPGISGTSAKFILLIILGLHLIAGFIAGVVSHKISRMLCRFATAKISGS